MNNVSPLSCKTSVWRADLESGWKGWVDWTPFNCLRKRRKQRRNHFTQNLSWIKYYCRTPNLLTSFLYLVSNSVNRITFSVKEWNQFLFVWFGLGHQSKDYWGHFPFTYLFQEVIYFCLFIVHGWNSCHHVIPLRIFTFHIEVYGYTLRQSILCSPSPSASQRVPRGTWKEYREEGDTGRTTKVPMGDGRLLSDKQNRHYGLSKTSCDWQGGYKQLTYLFTYLGKLYFTDTLISDFSTLNYTRNLLPS